MPVFTHYRHARFCLPPFCHCHSFRHCCYPLSPILPLSFTPSLLLMHGGYHVCLVIASPQLRSIRPFIPFRYILSRYQIIIIITHPPSLLHSFYLTFIPARLRQLLFVIVVVCSTIQLPLSMIVKGLYHPTRPSLPQSTHPTTPVHYSPIIHVYPYQLGSIH